MKKFLAALLIVGNIFFASTVDAEVKSYSATAEEVASEFESEEAVKLRALNKAIKLGKRRLRLKSTTPRLKIFSDATTARNLRW